MSTKTFQAYSRQLKKLFKDKTFKPYQINKTCDGLSFNFIIGDLDGQEWYIPSASSPDSDLNQEMGFLKEKLIEPGDVIFECGTHHGWTTLLLSKWVGDTGQVVGFEINHHNAQIAKQNMELNSINNVTIEQKATGASEGKVRMFRKSNASVTPKNTISWGMIKNLIYGVEDVEMISLDSYAQQRNIKPTLLKIDVEGYEAEVLKGAKNILESTPKLEIEIHTEILSRQNTSVQEILDLIDISRYHCWIQWDELEAPIDFDPQEEIKKRVHLFAIPK
ncbi:FkbM family methyltransferase [Coleofasciculus sp. F4-SAH-05]|uniref:FkbM family methyltransferase n=1 Tax=Coleofasciculus sp. F4-SAH-05 TaxID=3069525 RepID=UPI0033002DE1